MTKNIYLSKVHEDRNMNKFIAGNEFSGTKKPLSKETIKQNTVQNPNLPEQDKTMKKILYISTNKDSKMRIEINYSNAQNLKNQAVFINNRDFFEKETVKSLIKTLRNTKKPKSSKVEAD